MTIYGSFIFEWNSSSHYKGRVHKSGLVEDLGMAEVHFELQDNEVRIQQVQDQYKNAFDIWGVFAGVYCIETTPTCVVRCSGAQELAVCNILARNGGIQVLEGSERNT